ncbi:hypothetical protein [Nonomuraea jabiensis]|uniref:hypothetical protein n=1 Tax=Nonomuraea jabiensis TaxID=882448 RepID=UPI003D726A7E
MAAIWPTCSRVGDDYGDEVEGRQRGRTLVLLRSIKGHLEVGLAVGLVLVIALEFGLVLGDHHAWLACTIAVTRLALERRLPWRVMDFLDGIHHLGLLCMVGPVYQFRPAALHDHLAEADTSGGVTQSPSWPDGSERG